MRAMQYPAYGTPPSLVDLPVPTAGADEVLVRVMAASVNPVDWKIASGKLRLIMRNRLPCVPLADVAGVVESVGPGVTTFSPGDRVHARIAGNNPGGAAEYALATTAVLAHMPASMDFATAAGLPLAGMTALQGLRRDAGLPMENANARVLVVGASGGVGHLAVQIAVAAGAEVTGVCSGKNAALVKELGAHAVIDYTKPDAFKGAARWDVILDCVGGNPLPWLTRTTPRGTYASTFPGALTMLRSALDPVTPRKVKAVMLKSNAADLAFLDELYAAGKLKVVVDSRFPLEDLNAAWDRSRSGRSAGKIIVDVAPA